MKNTQCRICRHPDQAAIADSLIRSGIRPTQKKWPQFNLASLWTHARKHLPETAVKLREFRAVNQLQSVAERVELLIFRTEDICDKAMKKDDLASALAAIREIRQNLELLGRVTGELSQPKVQVNQVNQVQVIQGDIVQRIKAIQDRVRQRLASRTEDLGDPAVVVESEPPDNLSVGFSRAVEESIT